MPDNGAYGNGSAVALVAWLRSRERRMAPVEFLIGQEITDDGRGSDDHQVHGSGGDEPAKFGVHAPVIDHTGASVQELRARLDGMSTENRWTLP